MFSDDFESGAEGWTHGGSQDEWELQEPQPPVRAASSGSNVYGTDLDSNFEANTDAWLPSPVIDLTDVLIANLTFVEFHQVDTEIDFHNVNVSVLDANSVILSLKCLCRLGRSGMDFQIDPSGGPQCRKVYSP